MVAVAAFAVLLVAGGAASALVAADALEGKVVAFEKGKSIEIEVGAEKKTLVVDEKTEIKGDVAVGKAVKVEVKEGHAVKIEVKE
jgi:hypothetical protein